MIDAAVLLRSLIGEPLLTVRGRPNTVLQVAGDEATVATSRSPAGRPIPVAWVQLVLDRLGGGERVDIEPASAGYRSAFLGAVLRTLPMVQVTGASPPVAVLDPAYALRPDVLAELQHRLALYAELLAHGGPTGVTPSTLRGLGIYGGASGVWNDVSRTRGIGGADSVTVGLLHTGRHYPDDLSEDALLYHYPRTGRPPGRDTSEIEATKAASRLRLPVFVILQEGGSRTVHRGWVATWDDREQLFLVEFGPTAVRVPPGDRVDSQSFDLFEPRETVLRMARGRPNQQRFKMQVLQRYGGRCALCDSEVSEWIKAAHLVGDAESGTSDPRNGLPLCANHHDAFDRNLLAFSPDGRVHVHSYSAADLAVRRSDFSHLPAQPAPEALEYRWERRQGDGWSAV